MLRVLRAFEREGLEYVLIGAAAMGVHGLVRATEDLDLFYLFPDSSVAWDADRSADCIVVAVDGEMTGSVLQ